ncbi:unnamed protein product [Ixodes persulcatus]
MEQYMAMTPSHCPPSEVRLFRNQRCHWVVMMRLVGCVDDYSWALRCAAVSSWSFRRSARMRSCSATISLHFLCSTFWLGSRCFTVSTSMLMSTSILGPQRGKNRRFAIVNEHPMLVSIIWGGGSSTQTHEK